MAKLRFVSLSWLVSIVAMAGSLYFSEVMSFEPCLLCWYQRIFMYPLVFILAMGLMLRDRNTHIYALSLAIPGLIIAIYHNLLVMGIIPQELQVCSQIANLNDLTSMSFNPCTTVYINWFGFITIPFLSMSAFLIITLFSFIKKDS